ncbi:MAG: class I SAM-dependent methyltransferase [Clostridiales bacterium]|nr:class I SAM-dependent methyltransferase [Clostridiales bacterium]
MSGNAYEGLARYYDGLTADVDYATWLEWYQGWFRESRVPVHLVLDLACGTGTLTCMLAERGYTMIGADLSPEMLAEALEKAQEVEGEAPIFLNQAMDELDLFGTVDACVSSLDSINYITDRETLAEAFRRVHTFLMPGGYFLFDIIAPQSLKDLDGQLFVDETEDVFCLWRAGYDKDNRVLTYGMDLFEREGSLWQREQEEHCERAWEVSELEKLLQAAGFAQVQVFGGLERRDPTPEDRRLCFVCVNGEGGQVTISN